MFNPMFLQFPMVVQCWGRKSLATKTPSITQTSDCLCLRNLRISKRPRFIISLALKVVMSMIHIKYSVKWCDINPSIHHYPIFSSFEMGGKSFSNLCHVWDRHKCHDRPPCSRARTTRRSAPRRVRKWLNWRQNSVSWGTKCWMDMPTEAMLTFYGGQYKCIVSMYAILLIIPVIIRICVILCHVYNIVAMYKSNQASRHTQM